MMAPLSTTTAELRQIVQQFTLDFSAFTDAELSARPVPSKWSKKEVIGHLIDSGLNNMRRFVVGQYEPTPPHIVYNQDLWVDSNRYNEMDKADIIQLWRLINDRICVILDSMPEQNYVKVCNTGKETPSMRTLEWLARDYVVHLKHHIDQIIPKSFNAKYPQD